MQYHGPKQNKVEEGYPLPSQRPPAACWQTTTHSMGLLRSLLKNTQVPFSFPFLVLISIVIFLEKGLYEGSEMLLEPHQNSVGRGQASLLAPERWREMKQQACLPCKARR